MQRAKVIKLFPKSDKARDCRYFLRINQVSIKDSKIEHGIPIIEVEIQNERRFQIIQNELFEKELIY